MKCSKPKERRGVVEQPIDEQAAAHDPGPLGMGHDQWRFAGQDVGIADYADHQPVTEGREPVRVL
jgi:hypothetical protein